MDNLINLAIQVLPQSEIKEPYDIVDDAIKVIQESGLRYKVCPFETVVECTLEEGLRLISEVQKACYNSKTMTYIKIESAADSDVFIDDKMNKYN